MKSSRIRAAPLADEALGYRDVLTCIKPAELFLENAAMHPT